MNIGSAHDFFLIVAFFTNLIFTKDQPGSDQNTTWYCPPHTKESFCEKVGLSVLMEILIFVWEEMICLCVVFKFA